MNFHAFNANKPDLLIPMTEQYYAVQSLKELKPKPQKISIYGELIMQRLINHESIKQKLDFNSLS